MNTIIYSIDLGSLQTRLLVAEIDDSQLFGFKPLHCEEKPSRGMKRGQIENPDDVSRVINDLLLGAKKKLGKKYESEEKYSKAYCININGIQFNTESKDSMIDVSGKNRIDENDIKRFIDQIRAELNVRSDSYTISIEPTEYAVDGMKAVNVIGIHGQRLNGNCFVVTTTKKAIMPYNSLIPMVKFDQFCTTASAKAKVLIPPSSKNKTIALVDIGYGTINIAIVKGGSTRFECTIPLGADLITSDIENEMGVSHREAEVLKQNIETLTDKKNTIEVEVQFSPERIITINSKLLKLVAMARIEELAAYIGSVLSKSGMLSSIDLILLTGGGAASCGILECCKKRLEGKVIAILDQTSYEGLDNDNLMKFCASYGMAATYVKNNPILEPEIPFTEPEVVVEPPKTKVVVEEKENPKSKKKSGFFFNLSNSIEKIQDWTLGKEEPSEDGDLK